MGRLRTGDETRDVRAGDRAVIPPGAVHELWNAGEAPMTLLCRCAPADTDTDADADTVIAE